LKRRRSEEPEDAGEKRQRIEVGSEAPTTTDEDMSFIFARAAAAAAKEIEESTSDISRIDAEVSQAGYNESAGYSDGSTSDHYLFTQILSLPMLDSLVSFRTTASDNAPVPC
jgi:hypothetical protein